MQTVFDPLTTLLAKYSFGPCSANLCIFNNDLRAVCIRPQNYYMLNYKKSIVILLNEFRQNHNAFIVKYRDKKYTVSQAYSWSVSECWNRMKSQQLKTFVLFRDSSQLTYVQIVNALIAKGLFQV